MSDPCNSESALSLPWLWAIQAVASCNEIHISTVNEFVDVAPVVRDDFCGKTRELLALRCLEDLFDAAHKIHVSEEASASLYSGVGFDFSRSCEDVLYQILHKISLSDLKTVGGELLKWDVSPFILHKRATVKCDLHQLKESISEGTHPYTNYLRESSGLAHQNCGHPVHVNDNECSDLSKKDNKSIPLEVLLPDEIMHKTKDDAETIDLAAKKHEFLSLHCTFDHDISVSDGWTEESLCVKCNEGGKLLVCRTTACRVMLHKSCLSTYAEIDARGNFLCPNCAYRQAISEYREAKKEVLLARKELALHFVRI